MVLASGGEGPTPAALGPSLPCPHVRARRVGCICRKNSFLTLSAAGYSGLVCESRVFGRPFSLLPTHHPRYRLVAPCFRTTCSPAAGLKAGDWTTGLGAVLRVCAGCGN